MKEKTKRLYIFLLASFFLFLTNIIAQEAPKELKVVTEQANIRLRPDIGSIIIQQVPQGTILQEVRKEGEWYLVKLETDEGDVGSGYVHESLVVVIKPIAKKEEKKEKEEAEKRNEQIEPQPSPLISPASPPSEYQFDLRLSGGGNFVYGGDLNSGSQGLADFYSNTLGIQGEGEVKPARLSYIFGGELTFPIFSMLFFGIGADYFLGDKESRIEFQENESTHIFTTRPKIQALPLRLVLSFYPIHFFYIKSGVEYYFAKCAYFYRFEGEEFWQEWQGEATSKDFGFLGGFGFEFDLLPALGFFIEATGRYARITSFKGKDKYKDSEGSVSTEEGLLYFYQGKISGQKTYPLLFILEKKPSEAGVSDPKEAIIDFSGLSLRAGFKIRF